MTTPSQLATEISRITVGLAEAGHLLSFNTTKVQNRGGTWDVVWSSRPKLAGKLVGRPHTAVEYLDFLRSNQYTMLLLDGALLQLRYRFLRGELVQHSLTYYPCPVSLAGVLERLESQPDEESQDEGDGRTRPDIREYLDEQPDGGLDLSEIVGIGLMDDETIRLRGPIRFDYDARAASDDHPGSHVHLAAETCRCPVHGPLSPAAFLQFVIREYYPEIWRTYPRVRELPLRRFGDCIDDQHRHRLHWNQVFTE